MDDLSLYTGINDYIYAQISLFTEQALSKNLTLALTIVMALLTLWVMVQGYLIATGRSQEGLRGFLVGLGRSYFIIALALGVASTGSFSTRLLTEDLANGISQLMHDGSSDAGSECLMETSSTLSCKINLNLTATQGMLSTLDAIDTADDDYLAGKVSQAKWFAGVGTAGPAIVAGTMLIVYRISMALFIGFAPLFILCLLFKKTAPLFQKWLYYGLATIFAGVMLGVMSEISMKLTTHLFGSSLVGSIVSNILTGGSGTSGIMQTVTQQLGLGLILSTLLITVPTMAGMWFNGVMGSYSGFGPMNTLGGNTQNQPPSMGGSQQKFDERVENKLGQIERDYGSTSPNVTNYQTGNLVNSGWVNSNSSTDTLKNQSQLTSSQVTVNQQLSGNINQNGKGNTDTTKSNKGEQV